MNISEWRDISAPVHHDMTHWPGDPAVTFRVERSMNEGAVCNLSAISMGLHTGTHIDAPRHFVPDGALIDQLPLEAVNGRCRVIESLSEVAITREEIQRAGIRRGERILFKTRNGARWPLTRFDTEFVYISSAAAELLAEIGISMVGIDYFSVGGFHRDGVETHTALLGAGIWIVENLDLREISAGEYELLCLPVKLAGVEAAPARALLRQCSGGK